MASDLGKLNNVMTEARRAKKGGALAKMKGNKTTAIKKGRRRAPYRHFPASPDTMGNGRAPCSPVSVHFSSGSPFPSPLRFLCAGFPRLLRSPNTLAGLSAATARESAAPGQSHPGRHRFFLGGCNARVGCAIVLGLVRDWRGTRRTPCMPCSGRTRATGRPGPPDR